MLENIFHLKKHETDVKTEILAGFTTFSTMAYIIFVNPQILSLAGMDFGAVMVATIIASFLATMTMGLLANYPFALAPGMGLNAYFTYSIVLNEGYSWQAALGTCFVAGLILFLLTFLHVRQALMRAIPSGLRLSVAGGIGLFLAFIGLKNSGLVVAHPMTFVALGDMHQPAILLTGLGIILIAALMTLRIQGAIFLSILILWLLGLAFGLTEWKGLFALPPSMAPTFGQLDVYSIFQPDLIAAALSFVFVAIFDTTGTLVALAEQGKFLDAKGRLPRATYALMPDNVGTTVGAILGTSPLTNYLESAAGIASGGKTGLTAVVVALLFLIALFLSPLAQSIPLFATAPALITVGALMLRHIALLDWDDPSEYLPAFIILISIPLTFSIATGISLGFILFPVAKLLSGKGKETHWVTWLIAALFFLKYLLL